VDVAARLSIVLLVMAHGRTEAISKRWYANLDPVTTPKIPNRTTATGPSEKALDLGEALVATPNRDFIRSLMDFFDVKKDSEIQLVYNGRSCGLNEALWAPNFWLPTPATAACTLGCGYYVVDINLGEIFYNFPLHNVIQKVLGFTL
jgi:hypothetical protein